jgi:hypothetical protein
MSFVSPTVNFEEKKNLTRDEWLPLVLLFLVYCYSQYSLHQTINKCEKKKGVAEVTSIVFGAVWKVKCVK